MQPLEKLALPEEIGHTDRVILRLAGWGIGLVLLGCEPEPPNVLGDFPPPRPAVRAMAPTQTLVLPLQAGTVEIQARVGRSPITVTVPLGSGQLELGATNIEASRGQVEFDLGQATVAPAVNAPLLASALASPIQGRPGTSQGNFALQTFQNPSAPHPGDGAALRESGAGGGRVAARRVTARALGRLELHSVRAEQALDVNLEFRFAGDGTVETVIVESRGRAYVSLFQHGLHAQRAVEVPPEGASTPAGPAQVTAPESLQNRAGLRVRAVFGVTPSKDAP